MNRTITINVTRPDGTTENIDATEKLQFINEARFELVKSQTEKAGRGTVNYIEVKETRSNVQQLMKEYNNLHNEGAEGYVPEGDYFVNLDAYKTWEETKIYK
jgi:hypothetical protein